MRRTVALAFAAALATAAIAGDKKGGSKHPEGYAWEENFELAKIRAAAEGKLIFIDFYSDG
jgi:thiol:disulfide interchange protein